MQTKTGKIMSATNYTIYNHPTHYRNNECEPEKALY